MSTNATDRHARDIHRSMINEGRYPSCLNCEHCVVNSRGVPNNEVPKAPVCTLYNATPPVEIIVLGCDNWCIDIPF